MRAKIRALKPLFGDVATDLHELASRPCIDLIVVSTSESEHFEVLSFLKEHIHFRRLICEKPLVSTLAEAAQLSKVLAEDDVTINFLERHSREREHAFRWCSGHET